MIRRALLLLVFLATLCFLVATRGRPARGAEYSSRLGVVLLGNETVAAREKGAQVDTWVVRVICTSPTKCGRQAAHYSAEAERYGVRLVLRIWGWREGVAHVSPGGDCTDVDINTWRSMVATATEKLRHGQWIQLENEPNQCSSAQAYAERTAVALQEASARGVPVVLAGIADADTNYLALTLGHLRALGVDEAVDAVAIHEYDPTVAASVSAAQKTVAEMGHDVPVWVTETGALGDGAAQAEMVAKRLRSCMASTAPLCVAYKLQDGPSETDNFGLIRPSGKAKPAWESLAWFAATGDAP